jgi:hypothetical protein
MERPLEPWRGLLPTFSNLREPPPLCCSDIFDFYFVRFSRNPISFIPLEKCKYVIQDSRQNWNDNE